MCSTFMCLSLAYVCTRGLEVTHISLQEMISHFLQKLWRLDSVNAEIARDCDCAILVH